jgi:hypothetical protein
VSVSQKLKWRKLVNQLRYLYEELDLVEDTADSAGKEFQEYYNEYCRKNNIDVDELNRKHCQHLDSLYSDPTEESDGTPIPYSGSAAMVPFDEKAPPAATGGEELELTQDEREMHEIFSKLFRKIAFLLHPDKVNSRDLSDDEKKEMLNMFTKVKEALEEKRYFVLLDCADKYKIPLPKNYKQQTRWMRKEIDMVNHSIDGKTSSYNYLFAECETDEARDSLVHRFMQQVFPGYE